MGIDLRKLMGAGDRISAHRAKGLLPWLVLSALLALPLREIQAQAAGLLLGLSSDSSLWIVSNDSGIQVRSGKGLYVPRKTGFWYLSTFGAFAWTDDDGCHVVARRTNGVPADARWGIVGVYAAPIGTPPLPGARRLPQGPAICSEDYLADADESVSDNLAVTFLGNDHVSLFYAYTKEGESAESRLFSNVTVLLPLDSVYRRGYLTDDESGGPDSLAAAVLDECAGIVRRQHPATADQGLGTPVLSFARQHGHWTYAPGFIDDCDACANEMRYSCRIPEPPPRSLVGYDSLTVPWTEIQRRVPRAMDAFTAPGGGIAVVRDSTALRVFRIQAGRLGDQLAARPLAADQGVILTQWALGRSVARWDAILRDAFSDPDRAAPIEPGARRPDGGAR